MQLKHIIDLENYPISDARFRASCRERFEQTGVLDLPGFVTDRAIQSILSDGLANRDQVYASKARHNIYLSAPDAAFSSDHVRNRNVTSSKGCLTDDQISPTSELRTLYDAGDFRAFLCAVLAESEFFAYDDPLSSINLHFAAKGQELGWHFDNSSFAITLMVQPAEKGGEFEYVTGVRDADAGEMGFEKAADILDGRLPTRQLGAKAGTLAIFRGRNALHRVAPNLGDQTRILAVLAYNTEPDVALSKEARMTFFGRTG